MSDDVLGPRTPRLDLELPTLERPDGYEPLLANRADDLATIALAVSLLKEIVNAGGCAISPTVVGALDDRLNGSLPADVRAFLNEERRAIGAWLDERIPDELINPDVSHIRSAGDERWRAIVRYAIENQFDLRGEYYDPESETWPVVFGSPLFYDDATVVLERRDGVFVTVLFRDTRWLMPVRQQSKPELADVLQFRGSEE